MGKGREEAGDDFGDGVSSTWNEGRPEEPIEQRLRRAWLNGFKEGVDRAAFATQEATGRWDY